MKPSIVVALAAVLVAYVSASDPPQCPDQDEDDVVLLPNLDDCTKYYICDEGYPVLMNCSKGLIFDPKQRVCTWGDVKTCVLRPDHTKTSTTEPTTAATEDLGGQENEEHREHTRPPRPPRPTEGPRPPRPSRPTEEPRPPRPPRPTEGPRPPRPSRPTEEPRPPRPPRPTEGPRPPRPSRPTEEPRPPRPPRPTEGPRPPRPSRPTEEPRPPRPSRPTEGPRPSRPPRPTASDEGAVECPAHNGADVTLLPNPNDCTTFYSCETGVPILMECSTGLSFNPVDRVCEWGDTQCKNRPTEAPRPSESTTSGTTAPQPEPGRNSRPPQDQVHCPEHNRGAVILLPKEDDCTSFYSCNEGIPILMKCGEGLVFNPATQACDWGDVQCKNRPTEVPRPSESTTSGTTLPQPEPSSTLRPSQDQVHCPEHNRGAVILLPKEDDCTSFYSCNEGIPILMKCGEGLVFNPATQACDWGDVQCKNRPTEAPRPSESTTSGTTAPQPEPGRNSRPPQDQVHCPEHNRGAVILLPKEDDCTSFYSCNEGIPILMKCGEGLVFNPATQACDWGDVQCKNRPTEAPRPSESTTSGTTLPQPEPSSTLRPSQDQVHCPEHNRGAVILLPKEDDCTSFYSCNEGIPILMKCGEGLVFNPATQACDWGDVQCKNRPTEPSSSIRLPQQPEPISTSRPSQNLPKCPPHNGADVTLLPNPEDPTTFYSCEEGLPILMHCGDGLIFDARDRVCEYSAIGYKHGSTESSHSHHHHTKTSTSATSANPTSAAQEF